MYRISTSWYAFYTIQLELIQKGFDYTKIMIFHHADDDHLDVTKSHIHRKRLGQ